MTKIETKSLSKRWDIYTTSNTRRYVRSPSHLRIGLCPNTDLMQIPSNDNDIGYKYWDMKNSTNRVQHLKEILCKEETTLRIKTLVYIQSRSLPPIPINLHNSSSAIPKNGRGIQRGEMIKYNIYENVEQYGYASMRAATFRTQPSPGIISYQYIGPSKHRIISVDDITATKEITNHHNSSMV